jgi:ElaB/YqjD/DUF883 family membrane-anchored ribosome-binding protein
MAQQTGTADTAKQKLTDMADATGEKLKTTAADAQKMAGEVAGQAREYGAQAQDLAGELTKFLEKSIKEKPVQTLAGIAAIAFVIGAIWKK